MKKRFFGILLAVILTLQGTVPALAANNSIEANVAREENVLSRNAAKDGYVFPDKTEYKDRDTVQVSIGGGKVKYRIPKTWLDVEEQNSSVKNGHQYNLNQLDGLYEAEVFSVFYFDSNQLVNRSEYSRSGADAVQRAIVRNILKKTNTSFLDIELFDKKIAANKRAFDYYITKYKSYKVLFVFAPMKEGICCMVYVFRDDTPHEKDVLYMMQTIEGE